MIDQLVLSVSGDGVIIDVMVQPRASRTGVAGLHDGALRLRVTSPPVDGAANEAVVRHLSDLFGVPKGRVEIVGGQSSRRKRVRIGGIAADVIRARVAAAIDPA